MTRRASPWIASTLLVAACGGGSGAPAATDGSGTGTGGGSSGKGPPPAQCGNGVRELGEDCDDGANEDPDDGCTPMCTTPACGDGLVQPSRGEACDDGDEDDGDGCTAACTPTEARRWIVHVSGQTAGQEEVGGVVLDGGGNVIAIGTVWASEPHTDIWVAKYDPAGELLWQVTHDGPATLSRDRGRAVAVDGQGNVYAAGAEVTGGGESRGIWLARISPSGDELWSLVENGAGGTWDDPWAVAATPDDGVLVGGYEDIPAWLGRYDAQGNQLWARTFEGDGGGGVVSALALGPGGELYAGGNLDQQVWVARLGDDGSEQWSDRFDVTTEALDMVGAIAITDSGPVAAGGSNLAWLRAYDPAGTVLRSDLLDDRFGASLPGVATLSGGDLIAVGAAPPTAGGSQATLRRLTPEGAPVWHAAEPGVAGVSWARAVAAGPEGTFAVVGLELPALGDTDLWIALYGP